MNESKTTPEGPMVLVCGGRFFAGQKRMWSALDRLDRIYKFKTLLHGGASGADTLADKWADQRGLHKIVVKADWGKHGKSAGPIRNQEMLDMYAPNLVVAFEGGRGTADMVRRSKLIGIPVEEIHV